MITRRLEAGERVWIIRHTHGGPCRVERAIFTLDSTDGWVNVLTSSDGEGQYTLTLRLWLYDDWNGAAAICERLNKGEQS